jgi:hypothetical protein
MIVGTRVAVRALSSSGRSEFGYDPPESTQQK